jgi:hypothetical protein
VSNSLLAKYAVNVVGVMKKIPKGTNCGKIYPKGRENITLLGVVT